MCGIAGIITTGSPEGASVAQERLLRMVGTLRHRGPDDEGLYLSPCGRVALGNRRLAIRDLSPAGHMPMGNADGTLWITYNGEIYNAGELREELERRGYRFRSTTDTEVILHGYDAWGEAVVERLRGMFAFAVWDGRRGSEGANERGSEGASGLRLFLARDRLGIKPLYYARTPEVFLFASEVKALQAAGLVSREVSPAGLVGYLMMGSVPCPLTIYRDVQALEPGCTLTVPLRGGVGVGVGVGVGTERSVLTPTPTPKRYWSLPTDTVEPASEADAEEQVRAALEEAVRSHLVSDVPLGAFLSGGLDSSVVVALMRQATDGPIRTCSMVFEETEYSEAPYARAMAEAVGAEHYERVITARDLESELDHILDAMDQPTHDGVNTYFVSQTAREAGLTVALSGLGGDELFGGYGSTFQGVPRMLRALRLAQSVPGGAAVARSAIRLLPDRHRWARVGEALGRPATPASAYLTRRGHFSAGEVQALIHGDLWREAVREFDPVRHVAERADNGRYEPFAWASRAEMRTYMHHQLLTDTDVMSMAHSLEVRVPLLDHRLVETVLRLPARLKARRNGDGPKRLLVAGLGDRLPAAIRGREKQGFTFPLDRWIERSPGAFQAAGASPRAQSAVLRPDAVQRVRALHAGGRAHWSRPWALFVLQRWLAGGC